MPGEVLVLLVIPIRSPDQDIRNVQILAHRIPKHVLGLDAVRWIVVMQATRRVDVLIQTDKTESARIDPPLEIEAFCRGRAVGNVTLRAIGIDPPDVVPDREPCASRRAALI